MDHGAGAQPARSAEVPVSASVSALPLTLAARRAGRERGKRVYAVGSAASSCSTVVRTTTSGNARQPISSSSGRSAAMFSVISWSSGMPGLSQLAS